MAVDRKASERSRRATLGGWIAPPRFLLFAVLTVIGSAAASMRVGWQHGCLIGFDTGALIFLISLLPLLKDCGADKMRRQAAENDANRAALLVIAAGVMLIVLTVVAVELSQKGHPPPQMIALVIGTLVLTWLFTNTIFSLHYAHMYYMKDHAKGGDCRGVDFPQTPEPDYWDFVYFGYCLGMTFQTSDSNITAGRFRRVVTLHCLIAFVFSIGILAFSINVLGSAGGH